MEFRQGTEKEFRIMLRKMIVDKKEFTAFLNFCLEFLDLKVYVGKHFPSTMRFVAEQMLVHCHVYK